jgi:predicted cation transporter
MDGMTIGLLIILILVFIIPFTVKVVEHNLEYFLFVMGIIAAFVGQAFNSQLLLHALVNPIEITMAVLIAGLLFKWFQDQLGNAIYQMSNKIPFSLFVALIVILLGLLSSVITAIIAALVLVLIVGHLSLDRKNTILLTILSCFSIGLGAALTPIGEPLSNIVVSRMGGDFFYLLELVGIYIISGVIVLGLIAALLVKRNDELEGRVQQEEESYDDIIVRAVKVYLFVFGLTMLGAGFEPLINTYLLDLHPAMLFWVNIISSVLDNATLAAAEISQAMNPETVKAILMGLLISGGMLIPGNIPNIISAGKLKITSSEWAKIGLPFGFVIMVVYFVILMFIKL